MPYDGGLNVERDEAWCQRPCTEAKAVQTDGLRSDKNDSWARVTGS
jgi:hypothetical protein